MGDIQLPIRSASLTDREREILNLLANGLSDSEIAEATILTVGTVKWYNRQLYLKLDVHNRTQAITKAQQLGLLDADAPTASVLSASAARSSLPAPVTSFIGRRHELAELRQRLLASRLVTLTGPPGTGKTRLAVETALAVVDTYKDGAHFVSLAPVHEPGLVGNAIAQVMEVKEAGSESPVAALKKHLHDKHLLLVLDNFEHLLSAASLVSELLAVAPRLTVLATSREILHLYGEHEFSVPPLQLPDLKQVSTAESLKVYEAVELFVQRAHVSSPGFTLDDANAGAIATICVHLDGLPLAIELAAARIKFYAPQTLLVRLSARLEALNEGPRDLPARQRTLRSTLAWSYDLLDEAEKILFARLGIFSGGWALQDAEAVCGVNLNLDVAAGLESLLNKSLLRQERSADDDARYMMLETMREYALEKLAETGETASITERHARHFMAMAGTAAPELYGFGASGWLTWLESQNDNLRSALQWSLHNDDTGQTSLRFISHLARFWEVRGHFSEGRAWLSEALNLPGASAHTTALADALHGVSALTYLQCDYAATRQLGEQALKLYHELDDPVNVADSLITLGEVATEIGDYETAPALFQQAYEVIRKQGDWRKAARALTQLGFGALRMGDLDQAKRWLAEGMAQYERGGDKLGAALAASGLGEIALRKGQLDNATVFLEKSLTLRRELRHEWGVAASLGSLAWVALLRGEHRRAQEILRESLTIRREIGDPGGMAWCLEKAAEIAFLQGNEGRAARTLGAAARLRASVNSVVDPADQSAYRELVRQIQGRLTDEVFEAVWNEGQTIPLGWIIADVLPTSG